LYGVGRSGFYSVLLRSDGVQYSYTNSIIKYTRVFIKIEYEVFVAAKIVSAINVYVVGYHRLLGGNPPDPYPFDRRYIKLLKRLVRRIVRKRRPPVYRNWFGDTWRARPADTNGSSLVRSTNSMPGGDPRRRFRSEDADNFGVVTLTNKLAGRSVPFHRVVTSNAQPRARYLTAYVYIVIRAILYGECLRARA